MLWCSATCRFNCLTCRRVCMGDREMDDWAVHACKIYAFAWQGMAMRNIACMQTMLVMPKWYTVTKVGCMWQNCVPVK